MIDTDRAWVAGLLEGEGCFTMPRPPGKSPRIAVICCMTDRDVIERLQHVTGVGKIYDRKPRKTTWKPSWQWSVAIRHEAIWLMRELYPLMGERRRAKIDELLEYDRDHPAQPWYQHGTLPTYRRGCRCDRCVEFKDIYDEGRRVKVHKVAPARHGTHSKYVTGCRCSDCRAANAEAARNYRKRKREEALAQACA